MKKLAGLLLASSVVMPAAFADVSDDLSSGLSLDMVLQNSVNAGETVESATFKMVQLIPGRAGDVVAMAVAACADVVCERSVAQAAISAGADPVAVTAATAAPRHFGRPSRMSRKALQKARHDLRNAQRWIRPAARTTPLASYH